jgi:membrane protease YdiL (CAAX protease family)
MCRVAGPEDADVPHWITIRSLLIAWLIVAVAGGLFLLAVLLVTPGLPRRLAPQRRRLVAWTGLLVSLAFLAFYLIPRITGSLIVSAVPGTVVPGDARSLVTLGAIAGVSSLPVQIAAWVMLARAGGQRSTFGIVPRHTVAELLSGYFTWLLMSPAVYVVSELAVVIYLLLLKQPPVDHPIIETLQTAPVSFGLVTLLFIEAVIAAPIREELFFRGILQPFFADRPWGGDLALWMAAAVGVVVRTGGRLPGSDRPTLWNAAAPILLVLAILPLYRVEATRWASRWFAIRDSEARSRAVRAVVGTSALFANLHANVWPTPISLFVLSLGLGWVAYRTQSVVAPVFAHVLFNAIVFADLAVSARAL